MNHKRPEIQRIEQFEVVGLQVTTSNAQEFTANTAKLPALWQTYESQIQTQSSIPERTVPIFSVYSNYTSDVDGDYQVTVGMTADRGHLSDHSQNVIITSGDYLVFTNQGNMPQTVIDTWQSIWAFFEKEKNYQRSYTTDFERYDDVDKVRVYIGVSLH